MSNFFEMCRVEAALSLYKRRGYFVCREHKTINSLCCCTNCAPRKKSCRTVSDVVKDNGYTVN